MWLHQMPTHRRTQSIFHRILVESLPECSQELTGNPTGCTASEREREKERDISKDLNAEYGPIWMSISVWMVYLNQAVLRNRNNCLKGASHFFDTARDVFVKQNGQVCSLGLSLPPINPTRNTPRHGRKRGCSPKSKSFTNVNHYELDGIYFELLHRKWIEWISHRFQLSSWALMYRMPARDTVAGVACFRWLISNSSLIEGVSGIRSLLARVRTCTDMLNITLSLPIFIIHCLLQQQYKIVFGFV